MRASPPLGGLGEGSGVRKHSGARRSGAGVGKKTTPPGGELLTWHEGNGAHGQKARSALWTTFTPQLTPTGRGYGGGPAKARSLQPPLHPSLPPASAEPEAGEHLQLELRSPASWLKTNTPPPPRPAPRAGVCRLLGQEQSWRATAAPCWPPARQGKFTVHPNPSCSNSSPILPVGGWDTTL